MSSHRVGFNINPAGYSYKTIRDMVENSNAMSHLVLMSDGVARQLATEFPKKIIVSRTQWPDDLPKSHWTNYKMKERALLAGKQWRNDDLKNLYHYWPNEPIPSDTQRPGFLRSMCALMEYSLNSGQKGVIGNFAWGAILHWRDVQAGMWDDFIKEASRWTNRGMGYVGGHDYTTGHLTRGCAGIGQGIESRDTSFDDIWLARENNWHLFRWIMLAHRARELGVPMFRILLTECFWDRMPDLHNTRQMRTMDRMGGGKIRGIISQRNLWNGSEKAVIEQLQWAEDTYPSYVHGFHLFAYSKNHSWVDFDFSRWPELVNAISTIIPQRNNIVQDVQIPQRPVKFRSVVITPKANLRVRSKPDRSGRILGGMEKNKTYSVQISNVSPVGELKYIRFISLRGMITYASSIFMDIEEREGTLEEKINTIFLNQEILHYAVGKIDR